MNKEARTSVPIHPLIAKRWSPRAFSAEPIPDDIITSLLEAARWSPSSRNEQPWRFIVGKRGEPTFDAIFDCILPGNQTWAGSASLLLITVAKLNFDYKNRPNRTAHYDLGQAVATLTFQATAHNLYVHQMGGIDRTKVHETFPIPEDYEAVTGIAVGYLGDPSQLSEKQQVQESAERTRHPLDELIISLL